MNLKFKRKEIKVTENASDIQNLKAGSLEILMDWLLIT